MDNTRAVPAVSAFEAERCPGHTSTIWPPETVATITTERCWIIRRCTQRWVGVSLVYDDFPTPAGLMNRAEAQSELDRVNREFPDEFCAHRISKHCSMPFCEGHMLLRDLLCTQFKRPEDTCCEGVDMPSLGVVHSHDCRTTDRPVLRASRAYVPEPAPERVNAAADVAELAGPEGLFGQLLFAARDLAQTRVIDAAGGVLQMGFCLECSGYISVIGSSHKSNCATGRVLDLVERICAVHPSFNPNGKEAAPDGETGRAGDGIRSRVPDNVARTIAHRMVEEAIAPKRPLEDWTPEELSRELANRLGKSASNAGQRCRWCGPVCYGGAAHNARVEDGAFYDAGASAEGGAR